jgi:hypothetical protein
LAFFEGSEDFFFLLIYRQIMRIHISIIHEISDLFHGMAWAA